MNGKSEEFPSETLSLTDSQRAFQSSILHSRRAAPLFIADSPKASADERFAVYTEAYRLRLIEALAADYPALKEWLGDDGFGRLGRAYAETRLSRHFSIRWFGARLPLFLAEDPAYRGRPDLKELAVFEWALSEAFDAAESPLITGTQLAALDPALWPGLKLTIHPSLRIVELLYNTPQRWQALNRNETVPELETRQQQKTWAGWRQDLRLLFRSLPEPEARALTTFRQGCSFAEVCEDLCGCLDQTQVAASAASYLHSWLREGWIAGVSTSEGPTGLSGFIDSRD